MNNSTPLFRYITGNSKIHKMSSKYKILWFLLSIIVLCILHDPISIALFSILTFYMVFETKISINHYINNILVIWPVYIIALLIGFIVSFNIIVAILVFYKLIMFIILFLILTFTTSLSEIAWGFECLFEKLKKIKVPVSKIALKIALYIKFISTLFEQRRTIRKSMAYRGIPYNKKYYKTFKNMIIPIITLSYKSSRRMIAAMKLRFYGYSNKRTNYHENKVTKFDKCIIFTLFVKMEY